MKTPLIVIDFSESLLPLVHDFDCGEEKYARDLDDWIQNQSLSAMKAGTKVWLYFTQQKELVAYGALGTTHWKYPPPTKKRNSLAIIPVVAIRKPFWGKPEGPRDERYSAQILGHLILEAAQLPLDVPFLALYVHPENHRAIRAYEREGFQPSSQTYTDRETSIVYRSMVRPLVLAAGN